MAGAPSAEEIVACQTCGLVQRAEPLAEDEAVHCARCRFLVHRRIPDSRMRTLALSIGAAVLYVPANLYPIAETTYMGTHEETTIMQAVSGMFSSGAYFIGGLILCTSVLLPALKIVSLMILCSTLHQRRHRRLRAWLFKAVKVLNPWNMLEIMLLAILVSIAELGRIATVQPGSGVFAFAWVVVLTILATHSFDPRLIWDDETRTAS